MGRINYDAGNPTWSKVTRKDGTEQWKCTLRYYVDGKRTSRSKRFSAEESARLDTDLKKRRALTRWIAELNDEQSKLEKEEAERKRAEEEANAVAALPGAHTSVSEYCTTYIDGIEAMGSVRQSAIVDYRTSAKRIAEGRIGDVKLKDLTTKEIQAWETELLKAGKGVNTVLKYHRFLNLVCNHAVEVDDLAKNPCKAVKKPKREEPSPNSLDAMGFARLAATLEVMPPSPVATAAAIALFTGARLGECCGLQWKRYNASSETIRIEKNIARAGGKSYESTPKTAKGRRSVTVAPQLASMLERRREEMRKELEVAGMVLDDAAFGELYVIGDVSGRYASPTVISRSWKMLAETFDLTGTQGRRIVFHDLRHSFATRAIAEGADVKAVADTLGHTDARVTLNTYADATKEAKRRTAMLVSMSVSSQGGVKPYAKKALPE